VEGEASGDALVTFARNRTIMSAITQASASVAKTVAVSTGKVSNAKSMMVWRPHGNKYVSFDARRRREDADDGSRGGMGWGGLPRRGRGDRPRARGLEVESREEKVFLVGESRARRVGAA